MARDPGGGQLKGRAGARPAPPPCPLRSAVSHRPCVPVTRALLGSHSEIPGQGTGRSELDKAEWLENIEAEEKGHPQPPLQVRPNREDTWAAHS